MQKTPRLVQQDVRFAKMVKKRIKQNEQEHREATPEDWKDFGE